MIMVLALGMSMPFSMIVEHTSTFTRRCWKSAITRDNWRFGICPWPMPTRAAGASSATPSAARSMLRTLVVDVEHLAAAGEFPGDGFRHDGAPPLHDERLDGEAAVGGVAITDMSRSPLKERFSVRGMGVAVSAKTSTSARRLFSRSFWRTPNRCSSSMTTRPKFLNLNALASSRWVPMTMSTAPFASFSATAFASPSVRRRETAPR